MKSPLIAFGGKSRIADEVWARFGADVYNYVEPFCNSAAVLFARPDAISAETGRWPTETINDLNGYICNWFRAVRIDPDAVAEYCDLPCVELDLHARGDEFFYGKPGPATRKMTLHTGEQITPAEFVSRMRSDADWYDPKVAGHWLWFNASWLGTMPSADGGKQVSRKRPHLDGHKGVNRNLAPAPDIGDRITDTPHGAAIRQYMRACYTRLRDVRVCCGDWTRVTGPTVTFIRGMTAIFCDPPYSAEDRADVYGTEESRTVSIGCAKWCAENGDNPLLKIAFCGYDGEPAAKLIPPNWECLAWKTQGGYGSQNENGNGNGARERVFFSPACIRPETAATLWDGNA